MSFFMCGNSNYLGSVLMANGSSLRGQAKYTLQASSHITSSHIPWAKASHMAKLKVKGEGNIFFLYWEEGESHGKGPGCINITWGYLKSWRPVSQSTTTFFSKSWSCSWSWIEPRTHNECSFHVE